MSHFFFARTHEHTHGNRRRPIMPSSSCFRREPAELEGRVVRKPTTDALGRLPSCVCVVRSTLDRAMNGSISIIRSLSACFDIGLDWPHALRRLSCPLSTEWLSAITSPSTLTPTPTPATTHHRQQTAAARRRSTHVHTHALHSGGRDNRRTTSKPDRRGASQKCWPTSSGARWARCWPPRSRPPSGVSWCVV